MTKFRVSGDHGSGMTASAADFSLLYDHHVDRVWRALAAFGVPRSSLDDAVQEVFIVAYRRADSFAGRSSARTWLVAIARRVASRWHRTARRRDRRLAAVAEVPTGTIDLERAYACREAADRVAHVLSTLTPEQREAFVLSDIAGLARLELAAEIGVNPNTAWGRVRAARAAIARELGEIQTIEDLLAGTPTMESSTRQRMLGAIVLRLGLPHGASGIGAVKLGWIAWTAIAGAIAIVPAAWVISRSAGSAPVAAIESPLPTRLPTSERAPATPSVAAASSRVTITDAAPAPPIRRSASPSAAASRPDARNEAAATTRPPDSLTAERGQLADVRAAILRGDLDDALDRLHRYAEQFPSGVLGVEADKLRVSALCGAGRHREAQRIGGAAACGLTKSDAAGHQRP